MVYEYGIFNDEGCCEASMWSQGEADARAEELRAEYPDETYRALQMCENHRDAEQPKETCEECFSEDSWVCSSCGDEVDDDSAECCDDGEIVLA